MKALQCPDSLNNDDQIRSRSKFDMSFRAVIRSLIRGVQIVYFVGRVGLSGIFT